MSNYAEIYGFLCEDVKAFADTQSPALPCIFPNISKVVDIKLYPLRINFLPVPAIVLGISNTSKKTLIMQIDVLFPRNIGIIKANEVVDKLAQRYLPPANGIYRAGDETTTRLYILKPMETKPPTLENESGVIVNYVTFQYS